MVSASTDSSLRLWHLPSRTCTRVFNGHTNEKNFVGLSCEGEFLASGSEASEVRGPERGSQ